MLTSESRPRFNFVSRPSNFSNKAPKLIATPTITTKAARPPNKGAARPLILPPIAEADAMAIHIIPNAVIISANAGAILIMVSACSDDILVPSKYIAAATAAIAITAPPIIVPADFQLEFLAIVAATPISTADAPTAIVAIPIDKALSINLLLSTFVEESLPIANDTALIATIAPNIDSPAVFQLAFSQSFPA